MKEIEVWRLLLWLLWDCSRESALQFVHTSVSIRRGLALFGTVGFTCENGLVGTNSTVQCLKKLDRYKHDLPSLVFHIGTNHRLCRDSRV